MTSQTFLQRQNSTLLKRALVVGVLTGDCPFNQQINRAKSAQVDLVELRLDTFSTLPSKVSDAAKMAQFLLKKIKQKRLPVLLTVRSASEAGSGKKEKNVRTDSWRASLVNLLIPSVDLIDVENQSAKSFARALKTAKKFGVDVLLSHHDFKRMPSPKVLNRLVESARSKRTAVLKIAGQPKSEDELREFLMWGNTIKSPHLVLIGMGKMGLPSRLIGFHFGSILTYGHLGQSAAPGQWAAKELSRAIHRLAS